MFNLIVKGTSWAEGRDSVPTERLFEYTDNEIAARFKSEDQVDVTSLMALPTLFVEESYREGAQLANVGFLSRIRSTGKKIMLEYHYDLSVPAIPNKILEGFASELDINDRFEFSRTHWAVKNVDLFRVLLRNAHPRRHKPSVFRIAEQERIEPTLVSAMMPFELSFNNVYETLKSVASDVGLRCRRADDIWENPAVMQDVVSLIDKSKVVIADCTGRNPNVFYEIGIAHTLGREVILITQSEADIPFDLRHLRYIKYLNNGEGLAQLSEHIKPRLDSLTV